VTPRYVRVTGVRIALATLMVAGALPRPALAQRTLERPELRMELPADSLLTRRGPRVRATNMLSREKIRKLLLAGFPARFHFRVELWSERGWFSDRLESAIEYDVFARYLPLEKKYDVIQVENDHALSLGKYDVIADADRAVGRPFAVPIVAARIEATQYYLTTLIVEALSEKDLDEVERWLKGDVQPGLTGEANPASIISRGLRTFASRLLGGEKSEYEVASAKFRIGSR
jgi:hypothetical protein